MMSKSIHYLVQWGYAEEVRQFLKEQPEAVNQVHSARHMTPLQVAALNGNVAMAKLLLQHGAAVDQRGPMGKTALHFATAQSRQSMIKILLAYGASVDIRDRNGQKPEDLIRRHPRRRRTRERVRPSHAKETLKRLPELRSAIAASDAELVCRLLTSDGHLTEAYVYKGLTALHIAVLRGCNQIVNVLLDCGADPNKPDKRGETPLDLAAKVNNGTLSILRARLPQPATRRPKDIFGAVESGDMDRLVEIITASPLAVGTLDCDHWTPLHHAAHIGNKAIAETLLRSGADPDAKTMADTDDFPMTPEQLALRSHHPEIAALIHTYRRST